jgi:hypothetical protein
MTRYIFTVFRKIFAAVDATLSSAHMTAPLTLRFGAPPGNRD